MRELKSQINSSLFDQLLLFKGDANKETVLSIAKNGIEIARPEDIICDPYVFEILGLLKVKPVMESDLEETLIRKIENFLLELGRGLMFVESQQLVTIGDDHYYADIIFYNKILCEYVIIELKTKKFIPNAIGNLICTLITTQSKSTISTTIRL